MQRLTALLLASAFLVNSSPLSAQTHESSPMWGKPQFDDPDDIEDPEPWKESEVVLPPYPKEGDLVELNIPSRGDSFAAFIDSESLQVGDDGVVRYVVVLRSPRGVDNVIAEGLRCATREYREYGYGSGEKLQAVGSRPWRLVGQPTGALAYRLELSETYACQYDRNPFDKDTILKRIAGQGGGQDFLDDRFY